MVISFNLWSLWIFSAHLLVVAPRFFFFFEKFFNKSNFIRISSSIKKKLLLNYYANSFISSFQNSFSSVLWKLFDSFFWNCLCNVFSIFFFLIHLQHCFEFQLIFLRVTKVFFCEFLSNFENMSGENSEYLKIFFWQFLEIFFFISLAISLEIFNYSFCFPAKLLRKIVR